MLELTNLKFNNTSFEHSEDISLENQKHIKGGVLETPALRINPILVHYLKRHSEVTGKDFDDVLSRYYKFISSRPIATGTAIDLPTVQ